MNSLIAPDDHWMIWTFLVGMATLSLFLEQRFNFVKKITGAVVAITGGMIASNTGLFPSESPSYDIVWNYIVPLVIPLLLMKTDIRKVFKDTGRMAGAFHLSALGTIVGSIVAVAFLHSVIDNLELIGPAMTGSYIGGSVNFVAIVSIFHPPDDLVNATLVADSGVMLIYMIILITLPAIRIVRKIYAVSDEEYTASRNSSGSDQYWKRKNIGLLDIGKSLAIAFLITTISMKVSTFFGKENMPGVIRLILGQQYLTLTTFTVLFPVLFPKVANNLTGNDELGTFLIFIFFVMIGLPASVREVIAHAPLMILFCGIILTFNFLVTFFFGKIFKYDLKELIMAAIITSGGPMNGVAIAISKNWRSLILPSLLLGIWGYVIGNYLGYFMGLLLKIMFH
jgi:uncharacterized membrane protein